MDEKQDQAALIALEKALQINPDHYLAKQRVLSIRQGGSQENKDPYTEIEYICHAFIPSLLAFRSIYFGKIGVGTGGDI